MAPLRNLSGADLDAAEDGEELKFATHSEGEAKTAAELLEVLRLRLAAALQRQPELCDELLAGATEPKLQLCDELIKSATHAFFYGNLLTAGRSLLEGAIGSFGLVLSHSLDADGQILIAARGQAMSVAFYPSLGMVMFGSEQAATKVGMGMSLRPPDEEMDMSKSGEAFNPFTGQLRGSFRLDLDAMGGELLLLDWGEAARMQSLVLQPSHDPSFVRRGRPRTNTPRGVTCSLESYAAAFSENGGRSQLRSVSAQVAMRFGPAERPLLAVSVVNGKHSTQPFFQRVVRLDGNWLILPLPQEREDPVGADIADIPRTLKEQHQAFWEAPASSINRQTAYHFVNGIKRRMRMHAEPGQHDGSVDLLITGCEVSLWLGEQFAADIHLLWPKLRVVTLSANKLLAQLGQRARIPQFGFPFNEASYTFRNSVVLLISHSGSTFSTLAVADLLKAVTNSIFCMTSEWDTPLGSSVRRHGPRRRTLDFAAYVFTTHAGLRPAEPCSLSVAATHQLLTNLLLYCMHYLQHYYPEQRRVGASFAPEELQELAHLNVKHLESIKQIVNGNSGTRRRLSRQGFRWALHVLEGPLAWLMMAAYVLGTVLAASTPLSAAVDAIYGGVLADARWVYAVRAVDAAIYMFAPWWSAMLLRLLQGRPLLHRVAGRTLVIADIPWVAQSLEAYVSKLFALSYSIASLAVFSANPIDHLVHRHTHTASCAAPCSQSAGRMAASSRSLARIRRSAWLSARRAPSSTSGWAARHSLSDTTATSSRSRPSRCSFRPRARHSRVSAQPPLWATRGPLFLAGRSRSA